ncbi:MAG: TlpA disulfide reductase family protein [Bacteroidota bacterium]
MKKILTALVFLLVTQLGSAQAIKKIKMDALLKRIDTSSIPMVVNFWATWCGPCIREIPWFEKHVAAFKDKKVKLLLVSIDFPGEYPRNIAEFAKKNGYQAEILWLDESNADDYCPKLNKAWEGTIPVTLMVNNKTHVKEFYNQQLPEAKLIQELTKLVQ